MEQNLFDSVKSLWLKGLAFTSCEGWAITDGMGDRLPLSERLIVRLGALLERRGARTWLTKYLKGSPFSARGLTMPQLSMILSRQRRLQIDDLEGLAAGLDVAIPDLLGIPKWGDLSAWEQRLVSAFRAVDRATQTHALALIESLTAAPSKALHGDTNVSKSASAGAILRQDAQVEDHNAFLARGPLHDREVPDIPASSELASLADVLAADVARLTALVRAEITRPGSPPAGRPRHSRKHGHKHSAAR